jgi:hypothetical protein
MGNTVEEMASLPSSLDSYQTKERIAAFDTQTTLDYVDDVMRKEETQGDSNKDKDNDKEEKEDGTYGKATISTAQLSSEYIVLSCFTFTFSFLQVTVTEMKLWMVPRIDSRVLSHIRHPKDNSFPNSAVLPTIVRHIKTLWDLCFKSSNQQQPNKPSLCVAAPGNVNSRFLSHSSIMTGWEHLRQALYQISKVPITVQCHL